jgi:hypothetical protein
LSQPYFWAAESVVNSRFRHQNPSPNSSKIGLFPQRAATAIQSQKTAKNTRFFHLLASDSQRRRRAWEQALFCLKFACCRSIKKSMTAATVAVSTSLIDFPDGSLHVIDKAKT